jgi:hypothetical protein
MKKVDQVTIDPGKGDCMQAVVASLFERELEQVPKFIELKEEWYMEMDKYFEYNGYSLTPFYKAETTSSFYLKALKHDGGINGYFYAVVPSQTFPEKMGITHAVVVDVNLNIVHDPNPNRKALKLKPEDIMYVYTNKNDWYIDFNKKEFIIKDKHEKSSNTEVK